MLEVWDIATMTRLATVPVHDDFVVEHMAFTAEGTVRMGTRRTVIELPTDGERLARALCRRAGRDLTLHEWERHLSGMPHRQIC